MKTVGVVTCRPLPEPDPDEELLLAALEAAGVSASLLPWNDEQADPGRYEELARAKVIGKTRQAPALVGKSVLLRDDAQIVCLDLAK